MPQRLQLQPPPQQRLRQRLLPERQAAAVGATAGTLRQQAIAALVRSRRRTSQQTIKTAAKYPMV
jgi:hypothetical protein